MDLSEPPETDPHRALALGFPAQPNSEEGETRAQGIQIPEPLSISAILRTHNRERLFVNPLQWTGRQLQLLDCRFSRGSLPGPRKPAGDNAQRGLGGDDKDAGRRDKHQRDPSARLRKEAIYRAVGDIRGPTITTFKTSAMEYLLEHYGIHHTGNRLEMSFDRQNVAVSVQTDGLFCPPDSELPTAAYIDLQTLAGRREHHIIPRMIYSSRSARTQPWANFPVIRQGRKRLRRAKPAIEMEDPFIAAVLVSLAQKQRYDHRGAGADTRHPEPAEAPPAAPCTPSTAEPPPSNSVPPAEERREPEISYKVHLIALPGDARNLCFYHATIPSAFLDKLDRPSLYSPTGPVSISYFCVPSKKTSEVATAIDSFLLSIRDGTS